MKKQTLCKKAFLLFAFIPIMMQAQNNNQAARIDKTDDFKLEFHYSDKVLAQQRQTDKANNQQQLVVNSFAASNPQWKLSKVEIDQSLLSNNSSNYSSLLSEAKASFSKDIIYVENGKKALFASSKAQIRPIYFGFIKDVNSHINLHHKVSTCPTCSKTIEYQRSISGNTLQLRMKAEDEDLSDVFYLLTFNK